ncbi:MAG: sialidase family protein [Phycisphaeraceae bacterium]
MNNARTISMLALAIAIATLGCAYAERAATNNGETTKPILGVKDVCAWPNFVLMPDGSILATIFNNPSHATSPGDIETHISRDGGKTWEYLSTPGPREPDTLRNHQAAGLANNGDLVTLTTGWSNVYPEGESGNNYRAGLVHPWVSRSTDGGKTWEINRSEGAVAPAPNGDNRIVFGNIMPGADGDLRVAVYTTIWPGGTGQDRSWVYRSTDDGKTWGDPVLIDDEIALNETAILHLGDGQWLSAARHGARGGGLQLHRSTDDAKTWTDEGRVSGPNAHPGHLLLLKDGGIVLTYGNRNVNPRRVEARISDDDGKTWSQPIHVVEWTGDGGYPTTVEREDGKLVTAFYASSTEAYNGYQMSTVIWELED